MGLVGHLVWVNSYSKKQCRSLFCRVRAAVKKAAVKNNRKQKLKFGYDPWSYALNFDDGDCSLGERANAFHEAREAQQGVPDASTWAYILLLETR